MIRPILSIAGYGVVSSFCFALQEPQPLAPAPPATQTPQDGLAGLTLLHQFDFNERDQGNLEDVPMFWEPLYLQGFSRHAMGRFDLGLGHEDRSSFHLSLAGSNVTYVYVGQSMRVQAFNRYVVKGFIRPDHLEYSRAFIAACFLDFRAQVLPSTVVRSEYAGGRAGADEWHPVQFELPAAPSEAQYIGVLVGVFQSELWDRRQRPAHHIEYRDYRAGAWFDDIVIYAVPQLDIRTPATGHVLDDEQQEVFVDVRAYDLESLTGRVLVVNVEGRALKSIDLPLKTRPANSAAPIRVDLGDVPPGVYQVRAVINAGDVTVAAKEATVLKPAPLRHPSWNRTVRPYGVVLSPTQRVPLETERELILASGVQAAKIPLWNGVRTESLAEGGSLADKDVYRALVKDGVLLTAVLAGPPADLLLRAGPYDLSLIELLSSDPVVWRDALASTAAPSAGFFQWWQIGDDAKQEVAEDARLPESLARFRDEIRRFSTFPLLEVPVDAAVRVEDALLQHRLSVRLGYEIAPEMIPPLREMLARQGARYLDAFIPDPDEDRHPRAEHLAQWTQRLVMARHAGFETVYVAQPWDRFENEVSPREELLILRTLADMLGEAVPGTFHKLPDGARIAAFAREEESVLCLWADRPAGQGATTALQLGPAPRALDVWGREVKLTRLADGRTALPLEPVPLIVEGVAPWLLSFRQSVALEPKQLNFQIEPSTLTLSLQNPRDTPLSGTVRLRTPREWLIEPSTTRFDLGPGQAAAFPITIRFPSNEPAGLKRLTAEMRIDSEDLYFEVPMTKELGLSGFRIFADAYRKGPTIIVRQDIMNNSDATVSFRGFVAAPGQARINRNILSIQPGQRRVETYIINDLEPASAEAIRVGLTEIGGSRVHNTIVAVP